MAHNKVYIMGKVGDLSEDDVYRAIVRKFKVREEALKRLGYEVINPMKLVPRGTNWTDAMKMCITALMRCDKISPLPCTWYSTGAMIEFNLSQTLQIPIVMPDYEDSFLDQ